MSFLLLFSFLQFFLDEETFLQAVENTKLGQKSDEELEGKIIKVKKRAENESLDKLIIDCEKIICLHPATCYTLLTEIDER